MDDSTTTSQSSPCYTPEAAGPLSAQASATSPAREDRLSTTSNSIEQKGPRYRKTHQCLQCRDQGVAKYLRSIFRLQEHNREKHMSKDERPYRCTECSASFARQWSLSRHLKLHGIKAPSGRPQRQPKNKTKQTSKPAKKNEPDPDHNPGEDTKAGEERPFAVSNEAYMAQDAPSMIDPSLEMPDFTLYDGQQNTTGHGVVSMNDQLADQYGSLMPTNYNTNSSASGSSFQNHVAGNNLEPTSLAEDFDAFGSLNVNNYPGISGPNFNGGNTQEAFGGGEINEDVDKCREGGRSKA
ncbi:hypothetical protein LTR97_006443 [Elasticomyces elasticus]|uniref:C2H2-type domain-containing protein n=1 Tax=Elasticomyces elasticus TaxID=574655 RepID=A0AAN7W6I3_9PEZI|nr:hypothetical protein LTR97_006443 [Elasticomyces elasticus]